VIEIVDTTLTETAATLAVGNVPMLASGHCHGN